MPKKMLLSSRFWEVDCLRGLALVIMIVYHTMECLNQFSYIYTDLRVPFWFYFQRTWASVFIILMGLSLTLNYNQAKTGDTKQFPKYFSRGIRLFIWGLGITVATHFFLPGGTVIFGILHFLGVSVILTYPFLRWPAYISLSAGLFAIILGQYLGRFSFDFSYLLWLGFVPRVFASIDYFPLLPWFGAVLMGVCLGKILYPNGISRFPLPDCSKLLPIAFLTRMGRHSLLIYLMHIPVILIFIWILGLAGVSVRI